MISVVVLNYNGKKFLEACLNSLRNQTYKDLEVIVVDNGSSDGSAEYTEKHFPWARLVKNENNLGFAGGTNAGIRNAYGDYIITLNNDTWVESDFVEQLIRPMDDRCVGMCASKMLFPDGRINSTGICLSRSGAAWDRGMFEQDQGQYDAEEDVFGPCAGAALYRKDMLDEIGIFDENFFIYMEDVDLAFRGRMAGWKCIYVPHAKVHHLHSRTMGFGSNNSVYYGNRNIIWFVVKDFPTRIFLASLPWIIGRNLLVIPYYFLKRKGKIILISKIDALKGLPKILRARRTLLRKVPYREMERYINIWADFNEPKDVDKRVSGIIESFDNKRS